MSQKAEAQEKKPFRVEFRVDVMASSREEAIGAAYECVNQAGEVTAVFDENYEEV